MDWYVWLLWILEIPLAWFLWTALHETSHVIAAHSFAKLTDIKWWLYPHRDEAGNFYFAKVQWNWNAEPASPIHNAIIYLAPRVMDIVAAIALPFAVIFSVPWMIAWIIFWGSGIVDFIVGSLGISEYSDLKRAATHLTIDPNIIRIIGFAIISISIVLCFALIGFKYAS